MIPTAVISGFVNNTPLVAMLITAVEQWCKRTKISPSKLMIPLSYASIVGNFSIIAKSPNLVFIGLSQRIDPTIQFPFFEPGYVGVPIMVVAWIYMIIFGAWLLPSRRSPSVDYMTNPKEYILSVAVAPHSPVVGKSIKGAGLRHLDGMFLAEVQLVQLPSHWLSLVSRFLSDSQERRSPSSRRKGHPHSCWRRACLCRRC
jgi:di/tricarboxylate transporter